MRASPRRDQATGGRTARKEAAYRVVSSVAQQELSRNSRNVESEEITLMGYGMIEHDAFESMMAVLEIVDAADVEGKFDDTPRQVEAEHEVVS